MSKFKKEFQERAASNTTNNAKKSVYDTLIYTVFQKPHEKEDSGMVVALTSANPNEGVTYITRNLSHELAKCEVNSSPLLVTIGQQYLRNRIDGRIIVDARRGGTMGRQLAIPSRLHRSFAQRV